VADGRDGRRPEAASTTGGPRPGGDTHGHRAGRHRRADQRRPHPRPIYITPCSGDRGRPATSATRCVPASDEARYVTACSHRRRAGNTIRIKELWKWQTGSGQGRLHHPPPAGSRTRPVAGTRSGPCEEGAGIIAVEPVRQVPRSVRRWRRRGHGLDVKEVDARTVAAWPRQADRCATTGAGKAASTVRGPARAGWTSSPGQRRQSHLRTLADTGRDHLAGPNRCHLTACWHAVKPPFPHLRAAAWGSVIWTMLHAGLKALPNTALQTVGQHCRGRADATLSHELPRT